MKKARILSAILAFSVLPTLVSCNDELIDNIKYDNLDSFIQLTKDQFQTKLDSKESFVYFVGQATCTSCAQAKRAVKKYAVETENLVYYVEDTDYNELRKNGGDAYKNLPAIAFSPTFLIAKNGTTTFSKNIFKEEDVVPFLKKNLKNNNIYMANTLTKISDFYTIDYASTIKLESIVSNEKQNSVFFSWYKCGDCINFKENFFDAYVNSNLKDKKVYIFESNYYRSQKKDHPEVWETFATTFKFSEYLGGKVPAIVTYKNSEKVSYCVYSNNTDIREENGEFSFTTTFFDEIKNIKGKSETELLDKSRKVEQSLIKQYLDKYLMSK